MLVLDTNHARELDVRSTLGLRLLGSLDASADDVVITAITVEEQQRGWLAELQRQKDPRSQIAVYHRLVRQMELHAAWTILPWDIDAVIHFEGLCTQRVRISTNDLKIAAIALAHDATLLTRNTADFRQVPGFKVENWLS